MDEVNAMTNASAAFREIRVQGTRVSRTDLDKWEARRVSAVLHKFQSRLGKAAMAELLEGTDVRPVFVDDLQSQRTALAQIKMRLGHAGVYALLKQELWLSDRAWHVAVALSRGRTRLSKTELTVTGCTAKHFMSWFESALAISSEKDLVAACPDHYLLRKTDDGLTEVVETTGGAPLVSRLFCDLSNRDVAIPKDEAYLHQVVGRVQLADGFDVAAIRHQLRDDDEGRLQAKLCIEFPGTFAPALITGHAWHLACEFANWITAATTQTGTSTTAARSAQ
jgi:hypothetical protein